jgi:hypothetical protein
MAYAVLALGGWVSLTIAGMMLKIVPFLVWYRVYSPLAGRAPVPTLAQLGWPAAEGGAWVLLAGGMAALTVAVGVGHPGWIRAAGLTVAAGALLFGLTLARIVYHLAPRTAHHPAAAAPQARSS